MKLDYPIDLSRGGILPGAGTELQEALGVGLDAVGATVSNGATIYVAGDLYRAFWRAARLPCGLTSFRSNSGYDLYYRNSYVMNVDDGDWEASSDAFTMSLRLQRGANGDETPDCTGAYRLAVIKLGDMHVDINGLRVDM